MKKNKGLMIAAAGTILVLVSCFLSSDDQTGKKDDQTGPALVSGTVLDKYGKPVAGVVAAIDKSGLSAVSDSSGKFSVVDVPRGTYSITLSRYGFQDAKVRDVVVDEGASLTGNITLSPAFCTIKGTVRFSGLARRGAAAAVLAGAGVTVPNQNISALTGSNGSFTLENVAPEAVRIVSARSGSGWGESEVVPVAGEVIEGVDITIDQAGGSVAGKVVDDNGDPMPGVEVIAMGGGISAVTDQSGRYRLENIPSGVPVTVSGGNNSAVSGLVVDKNSQLDGVDLAPLASVRTGDFTLRNGTFIIPETDRVVIEADVAFRGGALVNGVALFLWDTDNDGEFDRAGPEPALRVIDARNNQVIPFGIITVSGDTVKGAEISIRLVSALPEARVGQSFSVRPGEGALFIGDALCLSGGIVSYQWDFDGNGMYDWMRRDVGTVTYRYFSKGTFNARFLVTASNGTSDSGTVRVTVEGSPAALPAGEVEPPRILSPQPGAVVGLGFRLFWKDVSADSYSVYLGSFSPPDSLIASGLSDTSLLITGLAANTTYYIQVLAFKSGNTGISFSSAVRTSENTLPLFLESAFLPIEDDTLSGDSVRLVWSARDADGQDLKYSIYFGDPPALLVSGLSDTSIRIAPAGGWKNNSNYYWEIEALDGIGTGKSGYRRFIYRFPNQGPVFVSGVSSMTATLPDDDTYQDTAHAVDNDGDALVFAFLDSMPGMALQDSIIRWNPGPGDTGTHTVALAVSDGSGKTDTLRWTVKVVASHDAALDGLKLLSGALQPAFHPDTLTYVSAVPDSVGRMSVTPSSRHPGAVIRVNGAAVISGSASPDTALKTGSNLFTVRVTAADKKTVLSYTVNVVRAGVFPGISAQPVSDTVALGQSAAFAVTASGTSLKYQWQKNGVNITGAVGAGYTIAAAAMADSGKVFRCIVSNTAGADTSAPAVLTVFRLVQITAQPRNDTVSEGSAASFSVAASGSSLKYQWQKNSVNLPGGATLVYNMPAAAMSDSGARYRCIVSNRFSADTTGEAVLIVMKSALVTVSPLPDTVLTGQTALFAVTATGSNLGYQWQKNSVNIGGAAGASYTAPAASLADSGALYRCIVSNIFGKDTSSAARLTVLAPAVVALGPLGDTVSAGQAASFSVNATGSNLSYQWQKNSVDIGGAAAPLYTTPVVSIADSGALYRCIVSNLLSSDTSTAAELTVLTSAVVTANPLPDTISVGQAASFSVNATGSNLSYQWQKNSVNIGGATATFYTTPAATLADSGALYRCIVSNAKSSDTSASAELTVLAPALISVNPVSDTILVGQAASFSVTAAGSGPDYQWQKNGVNIGGATASLYIIPAATLADSGTVYRCIVTNILSADTSSAAELTVYAPAVVTANPGNDTVLVSESTSFGVIVTGSALSFQWQKNGADIIGGVTRIYSIPAATLLDNGSLYRCIVSNTLSADTSAAGMLTVYPPPKIYVTNQGSNNVSVLHGVTYNVTTTIPVGSQPIGIGVNHFTGKVYVANFFSAAGPSTVSVINGTIDAVSATIPLNGTDPHMVGVNPNTNRTYVAYEYWSDQVDIINGITDLDTGFVSTSTYPGGIDINTANNKVYVGCWGSSAIDVFDGNVDTLLTSISSVRSDERSDVAVNSITNRIYTTGGGYDDSVTVIDGSTDTRIGTIATGSNPVGIAVCEKTNTIYVSNKVDGTVSVINGATGALITTVTVGSEPMGVAVSEISNIIYVANFLSGTVSVIDGFTNTVVKTTTVGTNPMFIGILE